MTRMPTKPYSETVSAILRGFEGGNRRIGFRSSDGSGDYAILDRLAKVYDGRVLWVVPPSTLQLTGEGIALPRFTIDSIPAIASRLPEFSDDAIDLVILNERYSDMNPAAERIVDHFARARVLDHHAPSHDFHLSEPYDMLIFTSGNGQAIQVPRDVPKA